jgi:spermidine/putrescine ABC transporter ATP-binding subunit
LDEILGRSEVTEEAAGVPMSADSHAAATPTVPSQASSKLELERVTYSYGTGLALNQVSFAVGAGEFVSLLGPSGCGKTTALHVMAGLLQPTSGRVLLDGRDITRLAPEKRPLGMVFQHLALFPHLSVAENVAFSLTLRKTPKAEVADRVAAMLELVGLGWAGDRSIHQLSGGQQQRVALARSLVSEPEILLLDEPLGALDLQIRKEMQAELKNLQRRVGITFIFVTHDQTEAMSMSDRIILMRDGDIVQDSAPRTAYTDPVNAFVASFVGETNMLSGIVVSSSGERLEVTVAEAGVVRLPAHLELHAGDPVNVSIRPEHLTIDGGDGGEAIEARILSQSFLGHEVLVEVESGLGLMRVRHGVGDPAANLSPGESVRLTYDRDQVRVFLREREG